jgi:NADH-quinone oxidoreductase subunit G
MRGDEVFRVTARKDEWGEIKTSEKTGNTGWICNDCRFQKKQASDWEIDGLADISRHSVIGQGKYKGLKKPEETIEKVMDGRQPRLLMDIHSVSEVNKPEITLSEINGPATSAVFKKKQ